MELNKNLISTECFSASELEALLALASKGKATGWREYRRALDGKVVGLLFLNPSLRTRASLQAGVAKIGGSTVALDAGSGLWALEHRAGQVMNETKAEHVVEAAGVLSRYFDVLGVRSFPEMKSWHEDKEDPMMNAFSKHLKVPLLNLESCMWHPCQALADALTIRELFGPNLSRRKFVLSWANHPKQLPMAVPNSALLMAAQLGLNVTLACPPKYELSSTVLELASKLCLEHGTEFAITNSKKDAYTGADVIYAKSWTPPDYVGQTELELNNRKELSDWIVTKELMALTNQAYFMHCLPVRRNVVVADNVIDSKQSVIFEQAENRLHVQNAWLVNLFS